MRKCAHDTKVVADKHVGEFVTGLQVAQEGDDLTLHGSIEGRSRFVQHQQGRFQDHRARQRDALRYGTVWLLISQHEGELAPTEGRAFDHLGWQFPDLRAAAEEIRAKGVEFTMEPRPFTNPLGEDMLISFVVGPDGVRIEIVQPRA